MHMLASDEFFGILGPEQQIETQINGARSEDVSRLNASFLSFSSILAITTKKKATHKTRAQLEKLVLLILIHYAV